MPLTLGLTYCVLFQVYAMLCCVISPRPICSKGHSGSWTGSGGSSGCCHVCKFAFGFTVHPVSGEHLAFEIDHLALLVLPTCITVGIVNI
jgi:hypothetical protein